MRVKIKPGTAARLGLRKYRWALGVKGSTPTMTYPLPRMNPYRCPPRLMVSPETITDELAAELRQRFEEAVRNDDKPRLLSAIELDAMAANTLAGRTKHPR